MRLVAYCRVSTEKEAQLESLENQKTFFEEFAEKQGHNLIRIYADEGISGKQTANRKEFMRMLEDAKRGLFDMVVVKDISRFARNTVDFLNATRELRRENIEVQFLSNNQTILGGSEFVLTLFSALAQEESQNLSKRVRFGKKENARKGRVPNLIYGYDQTDTFHLAVNEEEAAVVRQIFKLYTKEGYGSRKIALSLNEAGIRGKRNGLWCSKTVRRLLTNPIYCGTLINNKYETVDFITGKQVLLPESEHFVHDRPELAIIPKETFCRALAIMEQRRQLHQTHDTHMPGRYSTKHLFSTLIQCGHCGYSFSRKVYRYKNTYIRWRCPMNDQYTASRCPNHFAVDEGELTQRLTAYLGGFVEHKSEFIASVMQEYQRQYQKTIQQYDLEGTQKQLLKMESLKDKYKNMYARDIITIEELEANIKKIEQEKERIQQVVKQAQSLCVPFREDEDAVQQAASKIERFLNLGTWTNVELREILDKIIVHQDGNIKVYLKRLQTVEV